MSLHVGGARGWAHADPNPHPGAQDAVDARSQGSARSLRLAPRLALRWMHLLLRNCKVSPHPAARFRSLALDLHRDVHEVVAGGDEGRNVCVGANVSRVLGVQRVAAARKLRARHAESPVFGVPEAAGKT